MNFCFDEKNFFLLVLDTKYFVNKSGYHRKNEEKRFMGGTKEEDSLVSEL